jgi:hypothetical protein
MRVQIRGEKPGSEDLVAAIYLAAEILEKDECWSHDGRYHFSLGQGWSIALSAYSGDRIRVEACHLTRIRSTMFALAHRPDRLAGLIRKMSKVPEAV